MKEIGGYIELDQYDLPMLHKNAIALNCGRNCLLYLIKARKIRKIALPYFLCDSVINVCSAEGVSIRFYSISEKFEPINVCLDEDEWIYIVNFYGQLSRKQIFSYSQEYKRVIVDCAQAYFEKAFEGIDTIYTCRKFFGVPDGAFLYTKSVLDEILTRDESYARMNFLLGRLERSASEFYDEYVLNNELFEHEQIKKMSKLTWNLLHGIDYRKVKRKRTENYEVLYDEFQLINKLKVRKIKGAYAYPLWLENGEQVRKALLKRKIYIPILWPNVLKDMNEKTLEFDLAKNILPLPCDQRYDSEDMRYVIDLVKSEIIRG